MNIVQSETTEQFLSGGGEMGKLIQSMDWSQTALGPVESWPQSLRTSVSLCLSSTFPILIAWGPETIQIYNDSYRPICGAKHPEAMGQNFRICWETALPVVGDAFDRGQQGEGTYIQDQRMFLDRYGYLEETFMTFSFAPIRDESGGVGGIFHPITETTDKMLSARRTQALRDLGAAIGKAKSISEIAEITASKYQDYVLDVPFMLIYQLDAAKGKANLVSSAGLPLNTQLTPQVVNLSDSGDNLWPFSYVLHTGLTEEVKNLTEKFGTFNCEPYPETPASAMILPVRISGQADLFGFMIAGVSARRAVDQEYLNFYDLLGSTYNTAVSNVYAYEQEQKRAEALAEIDRSKTAFFSNVSHEFRTPLTLMLGPLEDMLNRKTLPGDIKDSVEATHRNALRLLKLVNNLLDYSRVEAGRVQAAYQLLNLCELTTDLASSFRSIIEKAGMELVVECGNLTEDTYVDRQMWEKIVLNLLSNAFKYTLQGTIKVTINQEDNFAVLRVQDTGVGIPEKELPHMFERFHRVENSAGRTHEGTGIGLSLVHELVQLHQGSISVESTVEVGSTFIVKIPVGKAHLPQEQVVQSERIISDNAVLTGAFIKEAASLLSNNAANAAIEHGSSTAGLAVRHYADSDEEVKLLIVDDNADMRAYLQKLLEADFTVAVAVNGEDALMHIQTELPDLVLSDIMMPVMDGISMLRHIRSGIETARLPVILLSARAGEEARIDGLEAGADDYLVKPFSAAELLTKIKTQIKISKARGHAEQQLRNLLTEAPAAIAIYRGPQHIIELANDLMLQYWGRTAEETFFKPLFTAVPELERQGFEQIMKRVYETGEHFVSGELPIQLTRFGKEETLFVHLTIEALHEDNNVISGMMAVMVDITEQVIARKELEKVTDTLKLAMDAAGMGIWRTDWGTDNLMVSEQARIIHGIPLSAELSFDKTLEVVVPEHRERFLQAILNAVETRGRFSEDYQINPFDGGKRKWLNSTGKVELSDKGEVVAVIGTIMDITESKEDEIRKNDFIGMVSHELKTPLTSLSGYTQLLQLKAKSLNDSFTEATLEKVITQVKKMSTLINGFLNISRLESGKIYLNKQYFNIKNLITDVIDDMRLVTVSHEIHFDANISIELFADKDKVGNVLSNLLSNAIKYSPKGRHVYVNCTYADQTVKVSVTDEGMGIKPHDRERLFDRYYRVENQHTEVISGFGIGLYLCAEIIQRHEGAIGVESEVGKGSTFWFTLPAGNN